MSRVVWQFVGGNKMTTGHHIGFPGETIGDTSAFTHPKSVHHRFALMRLVVQSSAYQRNAETIRLSPGQEDERKRSPCNVPSCGGRALCHWLCLWKTADWLGLLSTVLVSCQSSETCSLASHDGFVYSQVSAMPSNAGGSTACVIRELRVYDHQAV